jgi:ABC-type polysaccharide/polyol phosphate transport system ATPase subunit/SAM-dependent methyltransferase
MTALAIRVESVTKDFEIYDRPLDVALEVITKKPRHKSFRALDSISFEVKRGEVLGIIGHNGAGKSTLLKIITGVLDATEGVVEISGKVTAILELGLGFNGERTGRDNIHLSGLLYGMTKKEIDSKLDAIISFSGIGDFIDRPVKTYSSGMQARLAFSVATAVDPDILIIDEALAAGDAMFVQKSLRRINELCRGGRTVLVVSHGTSILAQLCQRVMWLDGGKIRAIGQAMNVIQAYDLAAHQGADEKSWIETLPQVTSVSVDPPVETGAAITTDIHPTEITRTVPKMDATRAPSGPSAALVDGTQVLRRGPVFIDSVEILDANRNPTTSLTTTKPWTIRLAYHCEGEIPDETLGVALSVNQDGDLTPVMQWFTHNIRPNENRESYADAQIRKRPTRRGVLELSYNEVPFRNGTYILSIGILPNTPGNWWFWEYRHLYYKFRVEDRGLGVGAFTYLEPFFVHADEADGGTSDGSSGYLKPPTLGAEIRDICFGEGGYPTGWLKHTECPVCAGRVLSMSFEKEGMTHSECNSCKFVFLDPYPREPVIKKLYSGRYYTNIRELFEAPRLLSGGGGTPFSAPIDLLNAIVAQCTEGRPKGDWLDVGGGIGAFAAHIATERPDWTVTLNEFNDRSIEIAQTIQNIKANRDDAAALAAKNSKFDVISFIAVLEHIPNPKMVIEAYTKLLKPGGRLVIVVPNFTNLSASVAKSSSSSAAPPFHVSLFNRSNIELLLRRTGMFATTHLMEDGPAAFSLVQHVPFSDYFDISMPTSSDPTPRTVMRKPYEHQIGQFVAALAEADAKLGSYFADTDGKLLLTIIGKVADN